MQNVYMYKKRVEDVIYYPTGILSGRERMENVWISHRSPSERYLIIIVQMYSNIAINLQRIAPRTERSARLVGVPGAMDRDEHVLHHILCVRRIAETSRDEGIIGGIICKIGSVVYDGSIRNQLEKIQEQMRYN